MEKPRGPDSASERLKGFLLSLHTQDVLELSWMRLAAHLLKFCRDEQPSPEDWEGLLGSEPFRTIQSSTSVIVASLRRADHVAYASDSEVSAFPSREALSAFVSVVGLELNEVGASWEAGGGSAQLLAVAVARAAANAIDQVYGVTFLEWFRNGGELTVLADEPHPVTVRLPTIWLGSQSANTPPGNQPSRDLASIAHLRLGPRHSNHRFTIDFDAWNQLGPFGNDVEAAFAVGQPNLTLGEFELNEPEDRLVYRNRGPLNASTQAREVVDQAVAAGRDGIDLLVLPEYTLNPQTLNEVRVGLQQQAHLPKMIVSGFCYPTETGELVDAAWLCVPAVGLNEHYEVVLPPKIFAAPVEGRDEEIRTGSDVRVFVTRQWTFAVLICRDAMDEELVSRVAEMGVNLVVVPSMSPRSATMLDTLRLVRARSQAFVVLANGPARWVREPGSSIPRGGAEENRRVEGAFVGPYASPVADAVLLPSGAGAPDPGPTVPGPDERGMWTFRTASRRVDWLGTQ